MLPIVVLLNNNYFGIIYNSNLFIVQATGANPSEAHNEEAWKSVNIGTRSQ